MQVSDYTKTLNATNYASGEWARIMSEVQSRLKQDYRNFGYEQGPPNEAMIIPLEAAIATRMYFYMGQQCTTQVRTYRVIIHTIYSIISFFNRQTVTLIASRNTFR